MRVGQHSGRLHRHKLRWWFLLLLVLLIWVLLRAGLFSITAAGASNNPLVASKPFAQQQTADGPVTLVESDKAGGAAVEGVGGGAAEPSRQPKQQGHQLQGDATAAAATDPAAEGGDGAGDDFADVGDVEAEKAYRAAKRRVARHLEKKGGGDQSPMHHHGSNQPGGGRYIDRFQQLPEQQHEEERERQRREFRKRAHVDDALLDAAARADETVKVMPHYGMRQRGIDETKQRRHRYMKIGDRGGGDDDLAPVHRRIPEHEEGVARSANDPPSGREREIRALAQKRGEMAELMHRTGHTGGFNARKLRNLRVADVVEHETRDHNDAMNAKAFGGETEDPRPYPQQQVLDEQFLQHVQEEIKQGRSHPAGRRDSRALALFTTLKLCEDEHTFKTQLASVITWATLPLSANSPVVYLAGVSICNEKILQAIAVHSEIKNRVQFLPGVREGPHGTVLLGSAIEALKAKEPQALAYGFFNADILLSRSAVVALKKVTNMFGEYFLVGHRATVDVSDADWAQIDFFSDTWEESPVFQSAVYDRQDAEDFFLWSAEFWDKRRITIPNFHIGRPAYDNWLVNAALHTFQPVVDASRLLIAYHRKHDYAHLKKSVADGGKDTDQPGGDEQKKKSLTYWGGHEQKENYKMGLDNGGWQHGLIEFAPWGFECAGDSKRELRYAPPDQDARQAAYVMTDSPSHMAAACNLGMKKDWKPLSDGQFGDMRFYVEAYRRYVLPDSKDKYDDLVSKHLGLQHST